MNLDHLQLFPNQEIDGDPTECVALTIADIMGNIVGAPFEPDYIYARTLQLMNVQPNTAGLDPYTAILAAIAFGALPASADTTSALVNGELYVANYKIYSDYQDQLAAQYAAKGLIPCFTPKAITDYLDTHKAGVSLAVRWFNSFTSSPDGLLKPPTPGEQFTYHNIAVYDYDSNGLICKVWLGKDYGRNGYCILPYDLFNTVFEEGYAFNPAAWRWYNVATIAVTHPWAIKDILPQLYAAK